MLNVLNELSEFVQTIRHQRHHSLYRILSVSFPPHQKNNYTTHLPICKLYSEYCIYVKNYIQIQIARTIVALAHIATLQTVTINRYTIICSRDCAKAVICGVQIVKSRTVWHRKLLVVYIYVCI